MRWMRTAVNELIGLFIDDGSLAVAQLACVALAAGAAWAYPEGRNWLALPFVVGCIGILLENVLRAARADRSR